MQVPVQKNLRWGCDRDTADRISNFNRHYAEYVDAYFLIIVYLVALYWHIL
jgi:hypothetical protein